MSVSAGRYCKVNEDIVRRGAVPMPFAGLNMDPRARMDEHGLVLSPALHKTSACYDVERLLSVMCVPIGASARLIDETICPEPQVSHRWQQLAPEYARRELV